MAHILINFWKCKYVKNNGYGLNGILLTTLNELWPVSHTNQDEVIGQSQFWQQQELEDRANYL